MSETSDHLKVNDIKSNKTFFPNLDGLRFFSFFIVFLTHVFGGKLPQITEALWYEHFRLRLFSEGSTIGVSFFFVLSGFLISYLLLKEKEDTGKIHIGAFYMRRILRIWPLFYFIVIYGFVLTPLLKPLIGKSISETASPILCSLFMNNFNAIWNGAPVLTALAVLWSVAIEEQFYIVWPILFYKFSPKNYLYIFISVIALSTVFRTIHYKDQGYIELHTLGVIADMAIGGLGAYLTLYSTKFKEYITHVSRWLNLIPYCFVAILFIFKYEIFFQIPFLFIFKRVIISFFFIWIILEQNFSLNSFFKIGNLKYVSLLGKYTYSLYCLHPIAISLCSILLIKLGLLTQVWQLWILLFPISLLISLIISYFSYEYFEKRFLKLKDKFSYFGKA